MSKGCNKMKNKLKKIMIIFLFAVVLFLAGISQKCQAIADNHLRSQYINKW